MLKDKIVLIVESNTYLALDLCAAVEDLGAIAAEPVTTVAEALTTFANESIAAAIIDCEVADGDVRPLTRLLARERIPFVIQCTTVVPPEVAMVRPGAPILIKPNRPQDVALILAEEAERIRAEVP